MSTDAPYFGIDFGTTNSSMAWYDPEEKRADVLLNADGDYKTPSLVYFGEDGTLVGRPVEDLLEEVEQTNDPEERDGVTSRIVKSIKRNLINPPVIPLPGGNVVRPVEVVAEILGKLKRDAEEEFFHEPVTQVVVTCPAVFDTKEQQVLLEAAAKVGFERVEVLDEPTAAAITVTKRARKVGKGVLVYDLGAGTFDLSVVTRAGDGAFYSPVDPQGDRRCGGDDLDLALYRYCEEIAQEQLGRTISLTGDVDEVFLRQCRARKENLTKRNKVRFASLLTSENGLVSFKYEVERETFEGLIRPRLEGTATKTAQLFEQVKDRVDTVILIGGSSQVPLVERLLEEKLPVEPRKFAEKEYAVALGAAYHAHDVFGGAPDEVKEYRKALKICWEDRKLTETEIEWLASLKEKLDLDMETAARIERQVMGATIEEVLERQIKFAREQYGRVVELGWKDERLDALKGIPPARLDMLLDNRELFYEYDFADCPVSAAERKALGGDMPWAVFVMATRVATDSNLSSAVVADRLRAMADELGMSEKQARDVERDVLGGGTVKDLLERRGQEAVQTALREYRKRVEEVWTDGKLSHTKIKKLKASANKLGLVKEQTEDIERSVMDNTAYEILAEDNAVSQLLEKHDIARSQVKGSGKNGRITKHDVELYLKELREKERKAQEEQRGRKIEEEREKRGVDHDQAQELLDESARQREQGELDLALQHTQAACELAPDYPPAFLTKAQLLQQKGEWQLAVAAATSCLRIDPNNLDALGARCTCRLIMDDHTSAKQDADKMVALAPGYDSYLMRAFTNFGLSNTRAVVADIRSALKDPQIPAADVGPYHAVVGVLQQKLGSTKDAIASFEAALKAIPVDHDQEYSQNFSSTCGLFGIEVPDTPVSTARRWLWQACGAVPGDTRDAVEKFIVHDSGNAHKQMSVSVWRETPDFGLYYASHLAKNGEGNLVADWLRLVVGAQPDFDIRRAKRDRWIKDCKDAALQEFLTPKFSFKNSIGSFFNSLTLKNESAFRVTAIKVTINVARNDGTPVAPIQRELDSMAVGGSFTWQSIFPDPGWFGANISGVTVNVTCAED